MAVLPPFPQANTDVIETKDNIFTVFWRNYLVALDTIVRGLIPLSASVASLEALLPLAPAVTPTGLQTFTNSLTANVALNNASNFFTGPQVAQGNVGTWLVIGSVTLEDPAGASSVVSKLWDGVTLIASSETVISAASYRQTATLAGVINNPAGNLRMSCNGNSTSSLILAATLVTSTTKASTITAVRIG